MERIKKSNFVRELQILEQELLTKEQKLSLEIEKVKIERNAVKILLNSKKELDKDTKSDYNISETIGSRKENQSWDDYVLLKLKEIGGKGKVFDVSNSIIKIHPEIDETKIRKTVTQKLSILYKENKIGAKKLKKVGGRGKAPYEYYTLDNIKRDS